MAKKYDRNRAISMSELDSMNFKVLPFEGKWKDSFGRPEVKGAWIVWGNSSNGKSRFVMKLLKYLTNWEYGIYNSMEEGASESIKKAFKKVGLIDDRKRKVVLLDNEPIEELKERLRKKRSAKIVVIDSIQYSGLNYRQYTQLIQEFRDKLFIIISHAEGKNPAGRTAKSIRFDAFVKIRVEGFRAFPAGRYGGGKHYDVWPEMAKQYFNEDLISS